MAPKKKKLAENSKIQPKPVVNNPAVNGVQSRIGWVIPYSDTDQNYYMPQGGYDEQTRDGFTKLLKDRFGLNLEADPKDAARRIFAWNNAGKNFMNDYLVEMEELDLMPDCQEKFQKKAAAAKELEKGLFFEMAKGSLAIVPLGETEPRQILCDTDKTVFSVSEPLGQSSPVVMHTIYNNYKRQDLPYEPREPRKPEFREKEPEKPRPVEPFTMKAPGPKPQPPKLRAFTMERPVRPQRILDFQTAEELERQIYDEMLSKLTMNEPKKPEKVVSDPGAFTLEEPEEPKKNEYDLAEEPVKPDNYDAVKFQIAQMEQEMEALKPARDPRFTAFVRSPGEFDGEPPKKPQLDYPEIPVPPTYKKLPGEPKPKYVFYEPKLILRKPEGMEDPGDKLPEAPKYHKEPPAVNPDPEPEVPTVREEPPRPSGAKRFFRFLSSAWRAEVRNYDAWTRERDTFPERSAAYNARRREWQAETDRIAAEHAAWVEECKQLDREHQTAINEYAEKKYAWDEAMKDLEPENAMIRMEYEAKLNEYNNDKARLGDMFEAEKYAYEQDYAKWEAGLDAESLKIKAENEALREKYEAESKKFALEEAEYNANYEGCDNDPEKMKDRRGELEAAYEDKLRDYNNYKAKHDELAGNYEKALERVREKAKAAGRDPEQDVKDYEAYIAKEKVYDAKGVEMAEFIAEYPEIGEYETKLEQYKIDQELVRGAEESYQERMEDYREEHAEWKKAKDAHDAKAAAYKDYDAALKQFEKDDYAYKEKMKGLAREAKSEAKRRIDENERAIKDVYPEKVKEYENEKKAYDDAYWRWKQGCYDMEQPGGLIAKWEQNVKDYNAAKKAHERAEQKYANDVRDYPDKLRQYNTKLNAHVKELENYNKQMTQYKLEKEKYDAVAKANAESRDAHLNVLYSNPAYKDYTMKSTMYVNGYYRWKERIQGSNQYNALQGTNADAYKERQKETFKDYEKRKKNAPKTFDGKEAKAYARRVWEHDYLKKYPDGMKPYFKALNKLEDDVNNSLNSKFKKESDIGLNDYKNAAVDKMYCSLVRDKAEHFAKEKFDLMAKDTKPINKLLDSAHITTAKQEMLANKPLMKRLEYEYKEAKKAGRIAKSLQDNDSLRNIYNDAYIYKTGKKAVKDPVFGEYHGEEAAVEKAKALEVKAPH